MQRNEMQCLKCNVFTHAYLHVCVCVRVSKSAHRGSNAGLAKSPGLEVFNSDSKPFVESMYPLSDIATSVPNSFWYVDQNFSRGCLPPMLPKSGINQTGTPGHPHLIMAHYGTAGKGE